MSGVNKDLPESRWTREALIESEKRHRRLLENSPDIIFRMSLPDRKFDYISPAAEPLTGYTPDDFYSYAGLVQKLIHPDWKEYFNKQWEALLAGKIPPFYEYQAIDRAGITRWFHQRNMLVKDDSGHPIALEGIISDISARRQAEEALQKSEGKLNAMLQSVADPMSMMDKDLNIIWANETARQYFGKDLVGRKCYEAYHQRQNPCEPYPCITLRAFQDNGVHRHETSMIDTMGKTHFFECKANMSLKDENNEPLAVLEISRDITERKVTEQELKKSEARSRSIIEALPGMIFLFSTDGRFIDCQFNEPELLLLQPDQVIGKHVAEILPHSLANLTERKIKETLESGQVQTFEYQITLNNEERYFEARMITIEAKSVLALVLDITGRRNAEDALRNSERDFRSVIENISDGFYRVNKQGRISMASPSAARIFGYNHPDDVLGLTLEEFWVQPDKRNDLIRAMQENGTISDYEIIARKKDGTVFPVAISCTYYKDENGSIQGYDGIVRDITERKRTEQALRLANKKLKLLSGITRHDIRNQLTILRGSLTILGKVQPGPLDLEYYQMAGIAAARISELISFTKEYEEIGVNAPAWQDCRTLIDTAAKQAPLGQIVVKNDLPAGTEIFADPLVVKVCYNLMDNAVRYGGKITTIRFSVDERDGDHVVVCEDDGEGVSVEQKEKIFERGFGKNTGLGLFLSREILAITGISIRETGEPGKGARFEMTVPKGMYR